jgi:hypothetical protein
MPSVPVRKPPTSRERLVLMQSSSCLVSVTGHARTPVCTITLAKQLLGHIGTSCSLLAGSFLTGTIGMLEQVCTYIRPRPALCGELRGVQGSQDLWEEPNSRVVSILVYANGGMAQTISWRYHEFFSFD